MKEGWEIMTLEEVCIKITDGSHNPPKGVINSDFMMLSSKNIFNDYIHYNEPRYLTEYDFENENKRTNVQHKDVLLTIVGTIGRVAVVPEYHPKFTLQRSVAVLRSKENKLNSRFLMFLLQNTLKFLTEEARGVAQKGIYLNQLRNIEILVPPLPEQQRIVAILDGAFAAIEKAKANAEKNLKNAKELFESYLQGVFENRGDGWEHKTLGEISKTFGRGKSKHRPRNWEGLYGGDFPFIQTGDIRNSKHLITEYTQTYNEVGLAQSKLWKKGTICITIAANIAETGILTFDACFPDSVIGIEVDERFAIVEFVEFLLQSFKVKIQALSKGAAQANINLGTFENEFFPFPPLEIQKDIVKKLDALLAETKRLERIYQQELTDLEELKKSILQKAFNGELNTSND